MIIVSTIFGPYLLMAQDERTNIDIKNSISEFQRLVSQKQAAGMDVSRALEIDNQSKEAMRAGEPQECLRLLKSAIALLQNSNLKLVTDIEDQTISQQKLVSKKKENKSKIKNDSLNSPFGIQAPFGGKNKKNTGVENIKYFNVTNAAWVRLLPTELSTTAETLNENGIRVLSGMARPRYPDDINQHKKETENLIRKYKDLVDAWLIVNEAELNWRGTYEEYVDYFSINAEIIRRVDPTAKIVFCLAGGRVKNGTLTDRTKGFIEGVLENNLGQYFDVLDFHHQGKHDEYLEISQKVTIYTELLSQYGVKNKDFWITEFGTHNGDPGAVRGRRSTDLPYQDERTQAAGLIKKHVHALAHGVNKMFWTSMVEWGTYAGQTNVYFTNVGLINNPSIDGQSHKKLAYYAYKNMIKILSNSDWDNITIIRENDGVFIYKFIKDDKSIWVAWNENRKEQSIPLNLDISIKNIQVIESVPNYQSGKEVINYDTSFISTDANILGSYNIHLKDIPVFIIEK